MKGITWGIAPWLLARIIVMPMMSAGFFSGGMIPAIFSLMGHVGYRTRKLHDHVQSASHDRFK